MLHRFAVLIALGFWVVPVTVSGQEPVQPPVLPHIEMPPVAGMPFEDAQAIATRHEKELKKIHGVLAVAVGREGMLVVVSTAEAEQAVPKTIEGLPVQVIRQNYLPAPPGVVILRPGGVQEAADACPEGLKEIERHDWHFCIDPARPEPIPPLLIEPPVAGMPREEALEILERHRSALMQLPGVTEEGAWLDETGIVVSTTKPEAIPTEPIEGLPVRAEVYTGPAYGLTHTQTTRIRPIHGGASIFPGFSAPTLTGIGISQGEPWLIFPSHTLSVCSSNSPCPPAAFGPSPPLNQCSHQMQPPSVGVNQPPLTVPEQVGFSVRWGRMQSRFSGTSLDVAAAFMDNDTLENNGSFFCDRRQEMLTSNFTGMETQPVVGMNVTVVTQNAPHILTATITDIGQSKLITQPCVSGGLITRSGNQIFVRSSGRAFMGGDSGAPILETTTGDIVGMFNWADNMGNSINGGGTTAFDVRTRMGFDTWYGTQTSGFPLRCN